MLGAREQLSFWLPLLTHWCEGHCTIPQQGLQTAFVCPLGLLTLLHCLRQHGDSAAYLLKSLRSDLTPVFSFQLNSVQTGLFLGTAGFPRVHFISRVIVELGSWVPDIFTCASLAEPAALPRIFSV